MYIKLIGRIDSYIPVYHTPTHITHTHTHRVLTEPLVCLGSVEHLVLTEELVDKDEQDATELL